MSLNRRCKSARLLTRLNGPQVIQVRVEGIYNMLATSVWCISKVNTT